MNARPLAMHACINMYTYTYLCAQSGRNELERYICFDFDDEKEKKNYFEYIFNKLTSNDQQINSPFEAPSHKNN